MVGSIHARVRSTLVNVRDTIYGAPQMSVVITNERCVREEPVAHGLATSRAERCNRRSTPSTSRFLQSYLTVCLSNEHNAIPATIGTTGRTGTVANSKSDPSIYVHRVSAP